MCGISAIISYKSIESLSSDIQNMTSVIAHRGPDDEGFYIHQNVAIGHRRLSILDLSNSSNQPMQDESGKLVAAFNGEIYNYVEVRKELIQLGYHFQSQGDTEIFLTAFKHWGIEAFSRLNGMWAAIIFDRENGKMILSRDRYGIKPLVYFQDQHSVVIASEAKQIRKIKLDIQSNKQKETQFLLHGTLNTDTKTFWQGIVELPAGQYAEIDCKKPKIILKQWYQLDLGKHERLSYTEACRLFREKLLDSLRIITRSDVKIATLLSGGLDSSAILLGLQLIGKLDSINSTFSSCFPDTSYDETEYVDAMLRQVGVNKSDKIYPYLQQENYQEIIKEMIYHQDQPIPTPSHIAEYFIFRSVSKENKVVLSGQGADEYLGGYKNYPLLYAKQLLKNSEYLTFLKYGWKRAKLEQANTYHKWREYYEYSKQNQSEYIPTWIREEKLNQYAELRVQEALDFDSFAWQQLTQTSMPFQLHSEDRNAMMFSVESRQPFLDHHLVEFGLTLPMQYKMKKGWSKSIIRDAFPELPESVRWRKKKLGFPFPIPMFFEKITPNFWDIIFSNKALLQEYLTDEYWSLLEKKKIKELLQLDERLLFRIYSLSIWNQV